MDLLGFLCLALIGLIVLGTLVGLMFNAMGDIIEGLFDMLGCLAPVVLIVILVLICTSMCSAI